MTDQATQPPQKVGGLFDGLIAGILGSTAAAQKLPAVAVELDAVIAAAGRMAVKGQALGLTLRAAADQFDAMTNEAKTMTDAAARLSAAVKALAAEYGIKTA